MSVESNFVGVSAYCLSRGDQDNMNRANEFIRMELNGMHLVEISEEGSVSLASFAKNDVLESVISATVDLYGRRGFIRPWTGFLAVSDGVVVGTCGFAGPPANGEVEIAYFTFPEFEGHGVATEMARQLIERVRTSKCRLIAIAHTLPEENASTRILRRHGFRCLGVIHHPEDGPVWKWQDSMEASAGKV